MAVKKKKQTNVRREATGILMQALWVLLLLALVSYTWKDIPWEQTPSNSPMDNYIGPVGAWAAWGVFKIFGLVGFGVPLLLAVWGLLMIFQSGERVWPRVLWMIGILAGLCVLVDVQAAFWDSLSGERLNLNLMPGGLAGYFLGRQLLTRFLGTVGAAIISLGIVISGLFFVSQAHPAMLWGALAGAWQRLQGRREAWAAGRRTAQEQSAREARLLEKERKKLEKELERERRAREKEDRQREKENARRQKDEDRRQREETVEREKLDAQQREREATLQREKEEAERKAAFLKRLMEQRKADEEKKVAAAQAAKAPPPLPVTVPKTPEGDESGAVDEVKPNWVLPPLSLLQAIPEGASIRAGADELEKTIQAIRGTLAEFGIEAEVTHVEQGPVVTRYELLPAAGVKVERIGNLSANLTLALKADSVRVEAPIPGKGVVGIEVPNRSAAPVVLRQLMESTTWATSKAALPMALGQDVGGHVLMADLAALPHLLIAGATGQGKTVCMNSILAGLLMTRTPEELRLILIDPKIVEFSGYNGLPHLLVPVITDAKKVIAGLRIAIQEMERRFKQFHRAHVRDIRSFNNRPRTEQAALFDNNEAADEGDDSDAEEALPDRLPYWVIIIDELADLMLMAQQDIEPRIQKLTQLARATGIHMIIATQRPTVDIITGTIKSNVPGRVAFKVAQKNDSRVIIDQEGADKLVGKGDMLVLTGANKLIRAQGGWTKDEEIQLIANHWKQQEKPRFDARFMGKVLTGGGVELPDMPEEDEELLQQAIEVIRQTRRASTSSIQRRLRIGYTRAARIIDILEEKGMVGPPKGSEPREILFSLDDSDLDEAESLDEDEPLA